MGARIFTDKFIVELLCHLQYGIQFLVKTAMNDIFFDGGNNCPATYLELEYIPIVSNFRVGEKKIFLPAAKAGIYITQMIHEFVQYLIELSKEATEKFIEKIPIY